MANLRQASLRHANLALVTRTVLAAQAPPSRADVAAATSLTRSTVSRLVDELVAGGVLEEVESVVGGPGRPGRPATPLTASRGRFAALGLQVGVGHLAARLVDLSGTVLAERLVSVDLAGSDPSSALPRLGSLAAQVLAEAPEGCRVVGAGLALPGLVDVGGGQLLSAPNLGWEDVTPGTVLGGALGELGLRLRLRVGNEADLAAYAFAHPAPGRDSEPQDFVYLSGEVGIGGAIVVDGEVMTGRHGWAGEIGHVCVDPDGPPCRCGSTGCLEQYAGRSALLAATSRDGAVRSAGRALGVALSGVVNVLDIPTVVLGGHLAEIGSQLAPDLEAVLARRVLSAHWVSPHVVIAPDDLAAGALGAALVTLDEVVRHPAGVLEQ